jgi:Gly-Xaa carboxypeptidase
VSTWLFHGYFSLFSLTFKVFSTSSVNDTKAHMHNIISPLARKWGCSYTAFNRTVHPDLIQSDCHLSLEIERNGKSTAEGLEPAPITPSSGDAFALMAGTIKGVFGQETVVAPSGMHGESPRVPLASFVC